MAKETPATKKNSQDPVRLAYVKNKAGVDPKQVFITLRGRTYAIPFGEKGKFTVTRKEAQHFVGKSRMWGLAHLDNSAVLQAVEMDDAVIVHGGEKNDLKGAGGKKLEDMNYNELVALAQSKGLKKDDKDIVSGSIKKDELLALLAE